MANPNPPKNLKPRLLTDEDRRKGTDAANASKRRKKQLREMIEMMLTMPIRNGAVKTPKSMANLKNANVEVFTAMLAVQCQKALKGDTKAFTAVVNAVKDNININMVGTNTTEVEDVEALASMLQLIPKQESPEEEEDTETEIISDATVITNSGDNDGH